MNTLLSSLTLFALISSSAFGAGAVRQSLSLDLNQDGRKDRVIVRELENARFLRLEIRISGENKTRVYDGLLSLAYGDSEHRFATLQNGILLWNMSVGGLEDYRAVAKMKALIQYANGELLITQIDAATESLSVGDPSRSEKTLLNFRKGTVLVKTQEWHGEDLGPVLRRKEKLPANCQAPSLEKLIEGGFVLDLYGIQGLPQCAQDILNKSY